MGLCPLHLEKKQEKRKPLCYHRFTHTHGHRHTQTERETDTHTYTTYWQAMKTLSAGMKQNHAQPSKSNRRFSKPEFANCAVMQKFGQRHSRTRTPLPRTSLLPLLLLLALFVLHSRRSAQSRKFLCSQYFVAQLTKGPAKIAAHGGTLLCIDHSVLRKELMP